MLGYILGPHFFLSGSSVMLVSYSVEPKHHCNFVAVKSNDKNTKTSLVNSVEMIRMQRLPQWPIVLIKYGNFSDAV